VARPAGKSPELRDRILAAAMDCFDAHGFAATTLAMVVERSGVARATVYGHFSGKEELAAAAARVQLDALLAAAPGALARTGLSATLLAFNRRAKAWLFAHADIAGTYLRHIQAQGDHGGVPGDEQPSLRRRLRKLFLEARERGEIGASEDVDFLADGYALMWFHLCLQWLENREDELLSRRLADLHRLYQRGLLRGA
jgi:AcrR family transcriptional regulator